MIATLKELYLNNNYEEAVTKAYEFLSTNSENIRLRLHLVYILVGLDRIDEAKKELETAEKISKRRDAQVFVSKGMLQYLIDDDQYVDSFKKAIELDPYQDHYVYFLAGHPLQGEYIIIDEFKIIYSPIPKAGSTSIKNILVQGQGLRFKDKVKNLVGSVIKNLNIDKFLNNRGIYIKLNIGHRLLTHRRIRTDTLKLPEINLSEYYKFAVVRDDIARFLSYFKKNILETSTLRRQANKQSMYFGLPTVPEVNFFVSNLKKYQYLYRNVIHHTFPIGSYMHKDKDFYDDVYDIKQISELEKLLKKRLNIKKNLKQDLKTKGKYDIKLTQESEKLLKGYFNNLGIPK